MVVPCSVLYPSSFGKNQLADANNRIEMCSRSLLVEQGNRLILIDTGMGNKQSEKFFSHYDRSSDKNLDQSLLQKGFHRDDITDVFFTHLHFDHCGDAIIRNGNGLLEPAFKNAVFWSHENHWQWATRPNPREKASFLPENILPIEESGQLKLIKGKVLYWKIRLWVLILFWLMVIQKNKCCPLLIIREEL